MNGTDALKALERALSDQYDELSSVDRSRWGAVGDVMAAVRAALAQSAPQAESAGGDDPIQRVPLSEMLRLQARDKWIEEHGKPALEFHASGLAPGRAIEALAALTPDRR